MKKRLLAKNCETREELIESLKMVVGANMSLQRPISLNDLHYAVEKSVEWTEKYYRERGLNEPNKKRS